MNSQVLYVSFVWKLGQSKKRLKQLKSGYIGLRFWKIDERIAIYSFIFKFETNMLCMILEYKYNVCVAF